MIAALIVLFIASNYLFIESAFLKSVTGLTVRKIQILYAILLSVVFIEGEMNLLTTTVYLSLLVIYTLRVARFIALKLPKPVSLKHSPDPYYYLSLYLEHFLKPMFLIFIYLIPAFVLIFIFSRV